MPDKGVRLAELLLRCPESSSNPFGIGQARSARFGHVIADAIEQAVEFLRRRVEIHVLADYRRPLCKK